MWRLEWQIAYLDSNPDCVAVASAARDIDRDGFDPGTITVTTNPPQPDAGELPARAPVLLHAFLLARRQALVAAGGYRPAHYAEDTDLFWRLQQIGRLHIMADILGFHRLPVVSNGTIVQGRIAAVNSQLAALSAIRRQNGQADIDFMQIGLDDYGKAATLEKMLLVASRDLEPAEAAWLRIAVAARRLEMAGQRRNELDLGDCVFIRATLTALPPGLSGDDGQALKRLWAGTVSRLVIAKRFAEARALAAMDIVPSVKGRVVFRRGLPSVFGHKVRLFGNRKTARK